MAWRRVMIEHTLYIKGNDGNVRVWHIESLDDGLAIEHGVLGGSMQLKTEGIFEGLAGRTLEEQIELRIDSRVKRQLDKGYSYNIEDARKNPTNQLGLKKPMLAHKIKDHKPDWDSAMVQYKYDGHRCLLTCHEGEIIAYSRNGQKYNTIEHITCHINLEEGMTIDGELYCHGMTLQQISSLVKRDYPLEATLEIKYHVYDIMEDLPYKERYEIIKAMQLGPNAELVPTWQNVKDIQETFKKARQEGYEGLIIRHGNSGYEDGKRSKSLIKMKAFEDNEFEVISIEASKDGWAILNCVALNGKVFSVSAPGTMRDKIGILHAAGDYLGRMVTVEYANLTKDGVPFHPVAKCFKD